MLVYAANKLFLSSRLSSKIYTMSSRLGDVGLGQSLAIGTIDLTGSGLPNVQEIRDMAISSESIQPLPGKSIISA